MVVLLVEEGWGERGGFYLGYAKFCQNYLGEAAWRVCERKIICTFFGCYFSRAFLGGFKGSGV